MNNYLLIIFVIFLLLSILYNILLFIFDKKLKKLEDKIILYFEKRTNLVPSLYDITKNYITKHDEVFENILNLRKIEFSNYEEDFLDKVKNEIEIHHELNFIFKISLKHQKILNNSKFLLIRDLFIENSHNIGEIIILYKKIIKTFNYLIIFKNISIIGIFIEIKKRNEF